MVDVLAPQTEDETAEAEALFREARQRARRRRLGIVGLVVGVGAMITALVLALTSGGAGRGPASRDGSAGSGGAVGLPHPASAKTYPLPSDGWTPGHPSLTALMIGRLHVAVTSSGACAWVNGYAVVFPAGYRVRLNPTEVLGPTGKVIAAQGDPITSGGGSAPSNTTPPIPPSCLTTGNYPFLMQTPPTRWVGRRTMNLGR